MRCSLSFVGIMSLITLYQTAISASDVGVSVSFFQIACQSACGHNFSTLVPCGGDNAMERAVKVV